MWDSTNTKIGYIGRTQAGASGSARMNSKLEDQLIVTPEWANGGYIQFQLGNLNFNTKDDKDSKKQVYCKVGSFDPARGPNCLFPDAVSIAQMDCFFPAVSGCTTKDILTNFEKPEWKGGKLSDGSSL